MGQEGLPQGPFFLNPTPPSLPLFVFMNDMTHGPAKVPCTPYEPGVIPSPPWRRVSWHLGDMWGSQVCSEPSREKLDELDLSDCSSGPLFPLCPLPVSRQTEAARKQFCSVPIQKDRWGQLSQSVSTNGSRIWGAS